MAIKHWYGIWYAYGSNVINHGNRPNIIVAFYSKAERDAWARGGNQYQGEGERSSISASVGRRVYDHEFTAVDIPGIGLCRGAEDDDMRRIGAII